MVKKKWNIITFALSLIATLTIFVYYKLVCSTGLCSYNEIKNLLLPLGTGAFLLIIFFGVFLFLPPFIFKNWFKYIFSWGFPMVVYLTYITTGSSSIPAYGKVDVVKFWGVFFGVVTILFIAFQYYRTRTLK